MPLVNNLTPEELDEIAYLGRDAFFMRELQNGTALTFNDVTLATNYSEVLPRQADVSTQLHRLLLPTPIISADMDTVTDSRMAIAMAQNGGMGIIHYNMPPEEQVRQVTQVKHYVHGVIDQPISVNPTDTIGDVMKMKKDFGTFPVVDKKGKLVWLIWSSVLQDIHSDRPVSEAMTRRNDILTITSEELWDDPIETAKRFFTEHIGKNKLLIVDTDDRLKGLITLSDVQRITRETWQNKMAQDNEHRLLVGAALPLWSQSDGSMDTDKLSAHLESLVWSGVDAIAISSAHAHTRNIGEVIQLVRSLYENITIIAGNVTTAKGVKFLADAGANVIKVGQWPGSICTTRTVAGVGIPQLTAVYIASKAAEQSGVQIIADGGITQSWDIVKAFAAGANAVMLGGLLGSADEAPGEIFEINGKSYKSYRGMGSTAAMRAGSAARYGHQEGSVGQKVAPEGISAMKPASWPVSWTLSNLVWGVQSWMWYLWAMSISEISEKARFIRITGAGMDESRTHDVTEVSIKN